MSARTGMAYLIDELRGMCEAGTADYLVAGSAYWTDTQLQAVMDDNVINFKFEEIEYVPDYENSEEIYIEAQVPHAFLENDTSVTVVKDVTGGTVDPTNYSLNYRTGLITFNQDQEGTIYFVTGRSYNLNDSAVSIWERKAAHYSMLYNFSADSHSLQREVLMKHCLDMAERFRATNGMQSISIERDDC